MNYGSGWKKDVVNQYLEFDYDDYDQRWYGTCMYSLRIRLFRAAGLRDLRWEAVERVVQQNSARRTGKGNRARDREG